MDLVQVDWALVLMGSASALGQESQEAGKAAAWEKE